MPRFTAAVRGAGLVALVLPLLSCGAAQPTATSSDIEPTVAPSPSSSVATADDPTDVTGDETGDETRTLRPALRTSQGGSEVPACVEVYDTADIVVWQRLEVRREVTVTDVEPVGEGVRVGEVTYSPLATSSPRVTGAQGGDAPPADVQDTLDWADRQPLEGSTLEPGTYAWFATVTVQQPARIDAAELTYRESGAGREDAVAEFSTVLQRSCA